MSPDTQAMVAAVEWWRGHVDKVRSDVGYVV